MEPVFRASVFSVSALSDPQTACASSLVSGGHAGGEMAARRATARATSAAYGRQMAKGVRS